MRKREIKMGQKGVKIFEMMTKPLQRLPLRVHYGFGKVITWFLRDVMNYRRDEIMINIARSFPDRKYKELKKISDRFYEHFGEIFAEAWWFGGLTGREDKLKEQHLIEVANMDDLRTQFNDSRSIMLVTSHTGNWELIGGLFSFDEKEPKVESTLNANDICVVYKELRSKFWDEFIGRNRCAVLDNFEGYTESAKVLRYAVKHRNTKKVYVFLTDQYPYGQAARYELPSFLHQKTYTMTGAINLACKFGMSVAYMSMDRVEKGKYVVTFKKLADDASQEDMGVLTERYYNLLEEDINRRPENYLWSHKRWK